MIDNNYSVEGQMSLMDLDPNTWFGKTFTEHCAKTITKAQTDSMLNKTN